MSSLSIAIVGQRRQYLKYKCLKHVYYIVKFLCFSYSTFCSLVIFEARPWPPRSLA